MSLNNLLFVEGGGMKGAFGAGVLEAFLRENPQFERNFDYIIPSSANVGSIAYFLSGKGLEYGREIWTRAVASPQMSSRLSIVCNLLNPRQFRPAVDVRYLTQDVFREFGINYDELRKKIEKLRIPVFDIDSLETVLYSFKREFDSDEFHNVMQAAKSSPITTDEVVEVNGKKFIDGAFKDPYPFLDPEFDGIKKVLVLTQPLDLDQENPFKRRAFIEKIITSYGKFGPLPQECYNILAYKEKRKNEFAQRIRSGVRSGEIFIVDPPTGFRKLTLDNSHRSLRQSYDEGIKQGRAAYEEICEFLY